LRNDDGDWEPLLERAVQLGINLFDTSYTYQWKASMTSEERFGRILPAYRDRIILSTKFNSRDADGARREFEKSLSRLKTDHVDILMIHSIEESEDLGALERGPYREMVKLKEQGMARFIGFSSMNSAGKSRELLERLDLDVALLAMNPTKYGNFAETALPAARAKNVGAIAMKVMRDIVGTAATAGELLRYAWTQKGVATAVVGHYGMQVLEENVRLAREFGEAPRAPDRTALERRLAPLAGPHRLCWARPDYFDGMVC
jgi:aryl-alcohol dehydrogenase-like predicted oxidoreductase